MNYADFWKRAGAITIDSLILLPIIFLPTIVNLHSVIGIVIYQILCTTLWQAYFIIGHYKFGQTFGKFILKIKVTSLDGYSLSLIQSFQRSLVDVIYFSAFIYSYLNALSLISDDQILIKTYSKANLDIYNTFPSWYQEISRFWTFWYFASAITVLLNNKRRALHDFLGNTVVLDLKPKDIQKQVKADIEKFIRKNKY
jgi:uncharacterized RDD family membrane protein YckC